MKQRFTDENEARQAVWDRLQAERLARGPFPPHGRIPNIEGAEAAAWRLCVRKLFWAKKMLCQFYSSRSLC